MQRILFIVLVLFVVWRLLGALGKRVASSGLGADSYSRFAPRQRRRRKEQSRENADRHPEELVPCLGCGTFVPTGRILGDGEGRVFCSDACRRSFAERGTDAR